MAIRKILSELRINKGSLRTVESKLGSALTRRIENKILKPKVKKLGILGEQALKSTVPIDTQELRDNFISHDIDSDGLGVKVGVSPGTHTGRDGLPKAAFLLARLLQSNTQFKRSQTSKAEGPYQIVIPAGSPTARWIDKALREFKKERRSRITNGR